MILGIVAGQMLAAGGGGGVPGAWDPADVVMGAGVFTFASADTQVSNPTGGTVARGTVRSTTSKTAGKRYVEIRVDNYGTVSANGLRWGFSSTPDAFTSDWNNGSNKNITWQNDGTRYSYGQANYDAANSGFLGHGATPGDVFQMGIEIGVGLTFFAVNGGTPRAVNGLAFTEADVKVFAALGDGNFGFTGDDFAVTILTTAATQSFAAFAAHTPWDD